MLASEIRKENLTPEEINLIATSSGMASIEPFLLSILKKSRYKNITPVNFLKLQVKIAEKMIFCEKQIEIFKSSSDRIKRNDEWLSREIYKAHRRILKQIMDGVAFRFLNFDRPVLRQLAAHNQTGHLSKGFITEARKAEYIVNKTGFLVVLNDLTNFLRYGDLTVISPSHFIIDEVKTSGSSKGNQKKYLDHLIKMLNQKVFTVGKQTAHYIQIKGKPSNFLSEVETIIKKSKLIKEGAYAKRVSPYLWVSSIYLPKIEEYYKKNGKMPLLPSLPFLRTDISPPVNSLMFFDDFSPNTIPYTAFPFDEKLICEILVGKIQLKIVVNEKELVKSFEGKGWELTAPKKEDILAILDSDDINKIKEAVVNPQYFYTLNKGEFSYKLPREVLFRIESEFRSVKAIVDEAEGIMASSKNRVTRLITTSFSDEQQIWK